MILTLSARFKKPIALFLLGIFYAQLIIAGHLVRTSAGRYAVVETHANAFLASLPGLSGIAGIGHDGHSKGAPAMMHRSPGAPALTLAPSNAAPTRGFASAPDSTDVTDQASVGGPTQPEMQAFQSVNSKDRKSVV